MYPSPYRPRLVLLALLAVPIFASADVTVYAAASLTDAVTEIASQYEGAHKVKIKTSFAASGTLAKQIEAGAPADVFVSADVKWMDYLAAKGKIDRDARFDLAGNQLVLIAPKGKGFAVRMDKGFDLAKAFDGKLCTGETDSVPVGVYAKDALTRLGWWDAMRPRIVGTDDVRGALDLVQRGECIGIVYATDAKSSDKVDVIARFPDDSHAPIIYPAAPVSNSAEARAFLAHLKSSGKVLKKYGFSAIAR